MQCNGQKSARIATDQAGRRRRRIRNDTKRCEILPLYLLPWAQLCIGTEGALLSPLSTERTHLYLPTTTTITSDHKCTTRRIPWPKPVPSSTSSSLSSCCHCYSAFRRFMKRCPASSFCRCCSSPLKFSHPISSVHVCLSVQVVALFVLQILLCDVLRGVWCAKSVGICAFGYNTSFAGAASFHQPHSTYHPINNNNT